MAPLPRQDRSVPDSSDVDQLLRDGEPDWEAVDFDVLCSRCGYNLRLLTQPRCPECGLQFNWRVVVAVSKTRSHLLFEHRVSDQPVRSYFRTLWHSLRPRHFWRQVSIHDDIRPGPLWFLLLTSVFWSVLILHGLASLGYLISDLLAANLWSATFDNPLYDINAVLQGFAVLSAFDRGFLIIHGLLFGGVLAALVMLCSLRQTLGRCRVRTVHILRVVAYASAPFFICWQVLFLVEIVFGCLLPEPGDWQSVALGIIGVASLPGCLAFFLIPGLRDYLQLPHPRVLAITAAFVGFLFCFAVFTFTTVMMLGGF